MLKPITEDNFEIILKAINSFFNLSSLDGFGAVIYEEYLDKLRVWEITSFSVPIYGHGYKINDKLLHEFENKYLVKLKMGFGFLNIRIKDPYVTLTLMKLENR